MHYLGQIRVIPKLPKEIVRLEELAYNLYFSWHPEVRDLFIEIDRKLWTAVNHNPVKFLLEVEQSRLEKAAADAEYVNKYAAVLATFDEYMKAETNWFGEYYSKYKTDLIAYFTAEFGFHESLPVYAGGLGVLAGDHLKSASDLNLPLVGVSLFYSQTYFTQEIDGHGTQVPHYAALNPFELPIRRVVQKDGSPLLVQVMMANRTVQIQIWQANIGRNKVYLLDTNIEENQPEDRNITARLYGGDQEMRISQEVVLGMGGVLALEELGYKPSAWHMNEGHSVFLALERIRKLHIEQGLNFEEALQAVSANTIFTTHTPVPAGNDAFPLHIKDKYFKIYWESVGISRHRFMELGSQIQPEGYEIFNLTILALNLSRHRNGVSELHGRISRGLWDTVWHDVPKSEVPIGHITNGVHSMTWIARKTRALISKYLGENWFEYQDDPKFMAKIFDIPDEELWQNKLEMKQKLINHLNERVERQYRRAKIGTLQIKRVEQGLRKETLVIGFARRFATYKRATLVFRNLDRLKRIVNNPERPVIFVFSGKAHPKDGGGQDLIRQIHNLSLTPELRGKILFVENYDMGLARDLVSGVDVWMNNPRRTQEASGTSGQKAGMNGVINFSVLDGWWGEGYNGKNGWAFGDNEDFDSLDELDSWDSEELYDILENDIIPLYYGRNDKNVPVNWVQRMKESIYTVTTHFNTHRMVKDYLHQMYIPALEMGKKFRKNNFENARELSTWYEKIERAWSGVDIETEDKSVDHVTSYAVDFNRKIKIRVIVNQPGLLPEDLKVQAFIRKKDAFNGNGVFTEVFDMKKVDQINDERFVYGAEIKPSDSGHYQYAFRVLPHHKLLPNDVEMGMVKWAKS